MKGDGQDRREAARSAAGPAAGDWPRGVEPPATDQPPLADAACTRELPEIVLDRKEVVFETAGTPQPREFPSPGAPGSATMPHAAMTTADDTDPSALRNVPGPSTMQEPPAMGQSAAATGSAAAGEPPSVMQMIEAALFVGGPPLTAELVQTALRISPGQFQAAIDELNQRYRRQRRPYSIVPKNGGYVLAVKPQFRYLRDKLFGGPRESRLSPAALEVLALVAYRQPVEKSEIDAIRGHDSGSVLRQLVRFGLIAVQRRGESGHHEVGYGTTPRFLKLFQLASLDDLPRLGESEVL